MRDVCSLIWLALIGLFRSRASLQAEILTLRHQLNVLRRKSPQRLTFSSIDRLVLAGLYRLAPGVLGALKIVRPETVIRWHRAGFRAYWRWKSRPRGCACRKSNPKILVVQPAQDRAAKNGPGQFDGARDRRILLQR
jgi:hypothetical protein